MSALHLSIALDSLVNVKGFILINLLYHFLYFILLFLILVLSLSPTLL